MKTSRTPPNLEDDSQMKWFVLLLLLALWLTSGAAFADDEFYKCRRTNDLQI